MLLVGNAAPVLVVMFWLSLAEWVLHDTQEENWMIAVQDECYMLQGSRDEASPMKTVFIIAIQALFFPQL